MKDWLLARVSERHRPLAKRMILLGVLAFVAFELSRIAAVAGFLFPIWADLGSRLAEVASPPLWVAVPVLAATALAFVLPLVGLVVAGRFVIKRLSR